MKQNHSPKHTKKSSKKDDAVSSVVSEMLLLAIGVVLVAVFAVSFMNLLPSDRDDYVDVVMHANTTADPPYLEFWHKGGDSVGTGTLQVLVYNTSNPEAVHSHGSLIITNSTGNISTLFDIGACCTVNVTGLSSGDQVRLTTGKSIIYSGVVQ